MTETTKTCAHCGRSCGDYAGGWAAAGDVPLCHPNVPGRRDCYTRVTRDGEPLGQGKRRRTLLALLTQEAVAAGSYGEK